MQEKLFHIKPMRVARPTSHTIDISSVYVKMANLIVEWLDEKFEPEEFECLVEELQENFTASDLFSSDGYELARDLEKDMGFDSDSQLVDDMNSISYFCHSCLRVNVEKWVKDCEITPKYSIGDEVSVWVKNVNYIGEISKIYERTAEYSIFIEELGHVREGVGTTSTIKKFEEIEKDFFDEKHWK
jgi:hypothetical protein